MKYAIIIMDGAADEPLAELGGATCLEKAHKPNTDWISKNGRLGLVRNVPDGFSPGSDVALMSVLGYNPQQYYSGRAPLEAAAQDIPATPADWIFRCNLVTIADGIMQDYSAGHIPTVQAAELIKSINARLGSETITFYPGVSYRHLMVRRGGNFDCKTVPPHDITEQPVEKSLPRGKGAKELLRLMDEAEAILAEHEINKDRLDLGENPATNIWLWGQGHRPQMDGFRQRFGVSGGVITAVDLVRGMAKLMGLKIIPVEGATGYLDTNFVGKGEKAIATLGQCDFIFVHVEAPDECGHGGNLAGKIEAIEKIDELVVGPLLRHLRGLGDWRIMVLPDHPTPIRTKTHSSDPVPFAMAGAGIDSGSGQPYSETTARTGGLKIERGHELMEYFLKVGK